MARKQAAGRASARLEAAVAAPPPPPPPDAGDAGELKRSYKRSADFWEATKGYKDRSGTTYRLYRLYPVIDRKLGGHSDNSIDIQLEMDERYILRVHGSGDYQVFFHDSNQKRSQVSKTIVELNDPDYPAVLDQRELVVGHPKNQGYIEQLRARGLWKRDDETKQAEADDMNGAAAAAVTEMAGLAKDALQRADRPKTEEQATLKSIEIMGTAFTEAAKKIAQIQPPAAAAPAENSVLLEVLLKRMDQQHEMMMKLLEQKSAANPSAGGGSIERQIDTVDKLMAFAERLSSGRGGPSNWVDRLPEYITAASGALQAISGMRGPGAAVPAAAPALLPGVSLPGAPAPAAPAVESQEVDMGLLQAFGVPPEAMPFIRVGQRAIRAYKEGFNGAAFAESVEATEGEQIYAQLAALGRDKILEVIRNVPPNLLGAAAAVVTSPEFAKFLEDFIAYGQPEGDQQ